VIEFKYPEERDIVYFFSGKLQDYQAAAILTSEYHLNQDTALYLSEFFWRLVDCSIECKADASYPWRDGAEFWNDKLLNSISEYLEQAGFIDIWNSVVDQQ
jgi:hypothetical protein